MGRLSRTTRRAPSAKVRDRDKTIFTRSGKFRDGRVDDPPTWLDARIDNRSDPVVVRDGRVKIWINESEMDWTGHRG